jgi:hypothetical protein
MLLNALAATLGALSRQTKTRVHSGHIADIQWVVL